MATIETDPQLSAQIVADAKEFVLHSWSVQDAIDPIPVAGAGTPFVARVDRESSAREGDRIEVAVDTRMLHFFDLETGEAIAQ